jgi:pyruvate,water dikinase
MVSGDRYTLWLDECDDGLVSTVGGKCAGLGELIKAGAPVPSGFAVTTDAHRAFLAQGGLDRRLATLLVDLDRDDIAAVEATSRAIQSLLEETELPPAVHAEIAEAYAELGDRSGACRVPVAVRSSAVSEDLATASFAGQLETFFWVEGAEEIGRFTRRAWAGLYAPTALTYRWQMGLESDGGLMSVGVQEMLEPRAAGVMFTLNPVTGDRSKIMIEGSWGLGESVVRGDVDPDRYLVDKVTGEILERTIAAKETERRFDPGQGAVVAAPVSDDRARQPCLADGEVGELAAMGKRLERLQGSARDIEWAVVDAAGSEEASIWILQSRRETVWSQRERRGLNVEPRSSAVEYVLADLLGPAGRRGAERKDS